MIMIDNRQFNVNGSNKEMLMATLKLAFQQRHEHCKAYGYFIDKKKGMILLWTDDVNGATSFPTPLDYKATAEVVWAWLTTNKPKTQHKTKISVHDIECVGWDADYDHDGDNSLGWRVYCEDWGHVNIGEAGRYAIVAVKPAYLWHGK